MKRREFLGGSAVAAFVSATSVATKGKSLASAPNPELGESSTFYVSPSGSDDNSGAANSPFKSLHRAQEAVRKRKESSGPIKVLVREGTYYLQRPLRFLSEDSGKRDEQVVYSGYPGERVTISGGRNLSCNWIPYKDGVMMTPVLPDSSLHSFSSTANVRFVPATRTTILRILGNQDIFRRRVQSPLTPRILMQVLMTT